MERLFETVLGMSVTASAVILAVLLARLLLRRAPKIFSYALWAVVLFRLLCPFSIESAFSLLPAARVVDVAGQGDDPAQVVQVETGVPAVNQQVNGFFMEHPYQGLPAVPEDDVPVTAPAPVIPQSGPAPDWRTVPAAIWLAGAALLLGYSLVSLLRLRRRLVGWTPLAGERNVRVADHIPSPFVLGLAFPKIYLPSGLPEGERDYVLLHERTHIRRGDHILRALAWLALAVHWFNPLVWLAFRLAGRDMELSCDEAVLRSMGRDIRADYSSSLLRLSVGGKLPAGPLAFGGGDLQGRIKNVLGYRKPALWVVIAALIAVVFAGVGLATDQESLYIAPDAVASISVVRASSYTTTAQYTAVFTGEDRRKALSDPDCAQELPLEDGLALVRLINAHRGTVYGRGELELSGTNHSHDLRRIDCADGGFYLVDHWYWNGFSFDPRHFGDDSYTTLVTCYDAQGNAGTTWQMEYAFDRAYQDWAAAAAPDQGNEAADSLPADLTLSLDTVGNGPRVRIDGTVGGVALPRGASWRPPQLPSEYALGPLSMEYPAFSGGDSGILTAGWADEGRTSVALSTGMRAMLLSQLNVGWWEFTVDLDSGTVTEMNGCTRLEDGPDGETLFLPESISDEEAVQAARVAAKLLTAAEDFYQNAAQSAPAEPAYALNDLGSGVFLTGLDAKSVFWCARTLTGLNGSRTGALNGALGYLTLEDPRFLGGYLGQGEGAATALYRADGDGELLWVGYDDYSWSEAAHNDPCTFCFTVDLADGTVVQRYVFGYEGYDPDVPDQELAQAARTLAGLIRGAADWYAEAGDPPPEDSPLPITQPLQLWFGSGVGGWRTLITLHPDGSFQGEYEDYNVDLTEVCRFHGRFGDVRSVTPASWSMTLEELVLDTGREIGEEWTERSLGRDVRYMASGPYGFDDLDGGPLEPGAQFMFYAPEARGDSPDTELHKALPGAWEFRHWAPQWRDLEAGETLGCYGLRNMAAGCGFFDLDAWGVA